MNNRQNAASLVKFEPNVPLEIRLQYPDGLNVTGRYGPQVLFTLVDGRRMYVDPPVAHAIRSMGFQPGQPFTVVKRVSADKKRTRWDVNPATTKPEEIAPALERSIHQAQMRKPVQSQGAAPPQITRGTGTHGPAPQPQPRPTAMLQRVPMNVAFGEMVSFVNAQLKALGEQWNDEARQAAVCTLLIQAGKSGWLAPWQR